MSDAAFQSLSTKLHALWADLDDDERRVFAAAAASADGGPEVTGFAKLPNFGQLLPAVNSTNYFDIEFEFEFDIVSPRDPASGLPTGKRAARESGSGLATG
jgi:hypothetical protein